MSNKLHLFLILLTLFFCTVASNAEEAKKEENANAEKKEKKISGFLSAGGTLSSGNIDKTDIKATGGVATDDSIVSFELSGKYVFAESDHKTKNNGIESSLKLDFIQYRKWSPLLACEYIHNTYKGYNFRLDAVAGVKCNIYSKPKVNAYSISLAGIYDVVDYTDDKKTLDDRAFRLSLRPKMKQKIGDSVHLIEKIFYQPKINDFNDYLIKNETELECKIVSILYLSIIYEFDYRSVLPPIREDVTYEHSDNSLEFSLKLTL